jgi:hypothetical protein
MLGEEDFDPAPRLAAGLDDLERPALASAEGTKRGSNAARVSMAAR